MIASLVLSALLARCAPAVGPVTMDAVVRYESGARPYAIRDNTARRTYEPKDRREAIALARILLARDHNIDVGYAQINSSNFFRFGLNVSTAFDECANLATGAAILSADYAGAMRVYGPGQIALAHALSAYNAGGFLNGLAYARNVFAMARVRYAPVESFVRGTR